MARPPKCRKVCALPENDTFGPFNCKNQSEETIVMSVSEYEVIRLIDLEGLTQEECARQMNVARTTVQSIYAKARTKLAEALVFSKKLFIKGGAYRLCDKAERGCHRTCPDRYEKEHMQ